MPPLFEPASVASVDITSPFYLHLDSLMRTTTLPAIIDSLKTTGRYYALTWTPETAAGRHAHVYWDSDCYKVMEACCYYLVKQEDAALREALDTYVGFVIKAQWDDGYINSHFTLHEPEKRFTNLRDAHELYCAGHLAEFAVAYHSLTGSSDLIDCVRRFVELLHRTIIPLGGYPGHEELELALVRVYEVTGDPLYLETAGFFVRERGKHDAKGQTFYDRETIARGLDPATDLGRGNLSGPRDYAYAQAHVPLVEQTEIVGHAVRAVYLLTGALHYGIILAQQTHQGDDEDGTGADIIGAVRRLFDNMVTRKMYLTGGLGSVARSEGFGPDYFLPDSQEAGGCYSETCASFGLVMLCERFLRQGPNRQYADIMERALLNCVLSALGMDGLSFYYENPLATSAGKPWRRNRWFETSCCPPNIAKLVGLLPSLLFSTRDNVIAVHLYVGASLKTVLGDGREATVQVTTNLPLEGTVKVSVACERPPLVLALRIPSWAAQNYSCSVQGGSEKDGYLYLDVTSPSIDIDIHLPCQPSFVYAHPRTRKDEVAIVRGPLVYCAENVDNADLDLDMTYLSTDCPIMPTGTVDIAGVSGVPVLEVEARVKMMRRRVDGEPAAAANDDEGDLYSTSPAKWDEKTTKVRFIPYYLRENRGGNGAMRVWLRKADLGWRSLYGSHDPVRSHI